MSRKLQRPERGTRDVGICSRGEANSAPSLRPRPTSTDPDPASFPEWKRGRRAQGKNLRLIPSPPRPVNVAGLVRTTHLYPISHLTLHHHRAMADTTPTR